VLHVEVTQQLIGVPPLLVHYSTWQQPDLAIFICY